MQIFVISLKNENTRREHIQHEFTAKNLTFSFFDAITPENLAEAINRSKINIANSLTPGEISCAYSHISLFQKIIDENIDVAAIFEDDIYLSKYASFFLRDEKWIPKNKHIIRIEKSTKYMFANWRTHVLPFKHTLFTAKDFGFLGTGGYIITNQGAHFILKKLSQLTKLCCIDAEIFGNFLKDSDYKCLHMNPTLCIQDSFLNKKSAIFKSSLEENREIRLAENGNSYKFLRKIRRSIKKRYLGFLQRKIWIT